MTTPDDGPLRVGLVCPYSLDVPGGVQSHVLGLASWLARAGHRVHVLAPGTAARRVPAGVHLTLAGGTVPLPGNGSVARVAPGPVAAVRALRWLHRARPQVLHLHEPLAPSVQLAVLLAAPVPVVGTFHAAAYRPGAAQAPARDPGPRGREARGSRPAAAARRGARAVVKPLTSRLTVQVAVSEQARRTAVDRYGADPVVVPNGLRVAAFAPGARGARAGDADAPVVAWVGRLDDPRKGLAVLAEALPMVLARVPDVRVAVLGGGTARALHAVDPRVRGALQLLGPAPEPAKRALLARCDAYVAPHLGGESFGVVLVEALAAGAPVVASDLPAFRAVLDGGRYGLLVPPGDAPALADGLVRLLRDPARRAVAARTGPVRAARYDWQVVAPRLERLYRQALGGARPAPVRGPVRKDDTMSWDLSSS